MNYLNLCTYNCFIFLIIFKVGEIFTAGNNYELSSWNIKMSNIREPQAISTVRNRDSLLPAVNFTFATLASDLKVDVRINNSTTKRRLQLFISWTKPIVGRLPDSYNIHVLPTNLSNNEHCGDEVYYGFIRDPEKSNWTVPEYSQLQMFGLHDDLTILPDCTYRVILESNPHNGQTALKTTYKVPECVEDICSCGHAKYLSKPSVTVKKIAFNSVNVTWWLSELTHLDGNYSFIVRFGERMAFSKNMKGIYNMNWLKEIRAFEGKLHYFTLLTLPKRKNTIASFMVAVHLLDPRRCVGPAGNTTFEVSDEEEEQLVPPSKIEMFWLTVVPTVSLILVFSVAGIVIWKKSFALHRRLHPDITGRVRHVTNFRPTYRSVSFDRCSTSRGVFPALQERNVLYVEQEIVDAQSRGEADNYEISYSRLILGKEIGKGAFGRVFLAQAEAIFGQPGFKTVAVKKLKSSLKNSKSFDLTPKFQYVLDPRELESFALQISKGMAHLEQKQITHRDLAARNILVDKDKTLKISDFGLSRTGIYVNTKHKKVPLRWLSIEAIRDSLYSSKSDVWAFGIVLWEIGTLGGFPYPTIVDYDLLNYLLQGNRLTKPDNCSSELYNLMMRCWSYSVDARPTFQQLVSHFDNPASNKRAYVNFEDGQYEIILPPTEQQPVLKSEPTG